MTRAFRRCFSKVRDAMKVEVDGRGRIKDPVLRALVLSVTVDEILSAYRSLSLDEVEARAGDVKSYFTDEHDLKVTPSALKQAIEFKKGFVKALQRLDV